MSTETNPASKSIFQRIIEREIPASIVYEDDAFIAIRDIAPQAPVHVLVIPKAFSPRLDHMAAADLGSFFATANRVAKEVLELSDYRLVVNVGAAAGQMVFHTHIHILSGWDTPPSL